MPVVPLRLGTFISVLALAPIWVGNTSFWIERNGGQPASLRLCYALTGCADGWRCFAL